MENEATVEDVEYDVLPPEMSVIGQGPLPCRRTDAFCVMISSGLSLKDAFEQAFGYVGSSKEINEVLSQPAVTTRIATIAHNYNSAVHMTLVGHLEMLAHIRDSALHIQEVGVAYQCERARGEVAGLYDPKRNANLKVGVNFAAPKKIQSQNIRLLRASGQNVPGPVEKTVTVKFEAAQ